MSGRWGDQVTLFVGAVVIRPAREECTLEVGDGVHEKLVCIGAVDAGAVVSFKGGWAVDLQSSGN